MAWVRVNGTVQIASGTFWMKYQLTQTEADKLANQTQIEIRLYYDPNISGDSGNSNAHATMWIDNVIVYGKKYGQALFNPNNYIYTGFGGVRSETGASNEWYIKKTIPHNEDGTKTVQIKAHMYGTIYSTFLPGNCYAPASGSTSIVLTPIDVNAKVTVINPDGTTQVGFIYTIDENGTLKQVKKSDLNII